MRVQLQGQALRLRIDEEELASLLAGGAVENATRWPDGRVERQRLVLAAQNGWRRSDSDWCVELGRPRRANSPCACPAAKACRSR